MDGVIVYTKSRSEVATVHQVADRSNRGDKREPWSPWPPAALGGSQSSRFERLPYFKPPALPEVSDSYSRTVGFAAKKAGPSAQYLEEAGETPALPGDARRYLREGEALIS